MVEILKISYTTLEFARSEETIGFKIIYIYVRIFELETTYRVEGVKSVEVLK